MQTLGDILVLGLGRSGEAVARYCASLLGLEVESVTVVDASKSGQVAARAKKLEAEGVRVLLGTDEVPGRYDLAVASPGIAPSAPLMAAGRRAANRVISEVEFAYCRSRAPWVAITGTNGKTTTTALVAHLLNGAGTPARAVGNIGLPAIEAVGDASGHEVLVAEVSSFQLALTEEFHPSVAVLLNITPDHVDWHGSLEAYAADKVRVFGNLGPDDVAVIDVDDEGAAPYADVLSRRGVPVVRVCRDRLVEGGASAEGGVLALSLPGGRIELLGAESLLIKGPHNVSNALAAAAAAHAMGASTAAIARGLATFEPIEHRLEPAGYACGVEWFNDSKATNPDAVFKALDAFGMRPLVLLLGGRNKGNDFRPLAGVAASRARAVVAFGEAGCEIEAAFEGYCATLVRVSSLSDAVDAARKLAAPGDAVVLSPACASFDEFANYEERGREFKRLVRSLECQDDS